MKITKSILLDDQRQISCMVLVATFANRRMLDPTARKHLAEASDSGNPRSGPRILTLAQISLVIAATVTRLALKHGQSKVLVREVPGSAPFAWRCMTRLAITRTGQTKGAKQSRLVGKTKL